MVDDFFDRTLNRSYIRNGIKLKLRVTFFSNVVLREGMLFQTAFADQRLGSFQPLLNVASVLQDMFKMKPVFTESALDLRQLFFPCQVWIRAVTNAISICKILR